MTNSGPIAIRAVCANWAKTGDVEIIDRYLRERTAPRSARAACLQRLLRADSERYSSPGNPLPASIAFGEQLRHHFDNLGDGNRVRQEIADTIRILAHLFLAGE